MFPHTSIPWPLPAETCAEILRFTVEQNDPSSPDIAHHQRLDSGLSEGLGAQGHHHVRRNMRDHLKRLGLLADNRASRAAKE